MYCMRCGQEMPDSQKYCTNCGYDLSSGKAAVQAGAAAPGRTGNTPAAPPAAVLPVNPAAAAGRDGAGTTAPSGGAGERNIVPFIVAIAAVAAIVVGAVLFFVVGGSPDDDADEAAPASAAAQDDGSDDTAASSESTSTGDDGTDAGSDEEDADDESVATGAPHFDTLSTSSTLVGGTQSFQPDLLVDGDTSTYWAEGDAGLGEGSWIEFDAEEKQNVSSVTIMGGCNETEDLYWQNGRPRAITISFDDGSHTGTTLSDTPFAWQTVTLDEPVQTSSVRITIDSVYGGSATSDTCVSEIEIR